MCKKNHEDSSFTQISLVNCKYVQSFDQMINMYNVNVKKKNVKSISLIVWFYLTNYANTICCEGGRKSSIKEIR